MPISPAEVAFVNAMDAQERSRNLEARIARLEAALSTAEADRKALMEVVRGAMCRRLDGEHTLKTAIIALPPHLMKEAQE